MFGLNSYSQNDSITVRFVPTFNGELLVLDKNYPLHNYDSARIRQLKFYVSNFSFITQDSTKTPHQNMGYLIDLEDKLQLKLPLNSQFAFDSIGFNLGIDSLTNSGGALSGDLDPINGMYWAWQSGYINFKLEGTSPACYARKSKFQFHIGGYLSPFNSIQEVTLGVHDSTLIKIEIPIDQLLTRVVVRSDHTIMSPNKQAVWFAEKIGKAIKLKR